MKEKILITGANGQLGTELSEALGSVYGDENLILSDVRRPSKKVELGHFELLDVTKSEQLEFIIRKHRITQIYHLAAILSAAGEKNPTLAWHVNLQGTLNILETAKNYKIKKVFIPSSIAVFGSSTPKIKTNQKTIVEPQTVYGISKYAGELWSKYYFEHFGLDVRSLRYPGLISYKTPPGGGTTDYAVEIFFKAVENNFYTCFLEQDTYLPMMYMPDAIRGTLDLMETESKNITVRTSYNFAAVTFSPNEIAKEIQKHLPNFKINYEPDFRQNIANSWVQSIDDTEAKNDWNWKHEFDLGRITQDMLSNLKKISKKNMDQMAKIM